MIKATNRVSKTFQQKDDKVRKHKLPKYYLAKYTISCNPQLEEHSDHCDSNQYLRENIPDALRDHLPTVLELTPTDGESGVPDKAVNATDEKSLKFRGMACLQRCEKYMDKCTDDT